jgi:hypothetical protein
MQFWGEHYIPLESTSPSYIRHRPKGLRSARAHQRVE